MTERNVTIPVPATLTNPTRGKWHATAGPVAADGTTAAAARAQLAATVADLLDRWEPPAVVCYGDAFAVVSPGPGGGVRIDQYRSGRCMGVTVTGGTVADGRRYALRSLVQSETDWTTTESIARGWTRLTGDPDAQADHRRYAAWQYAAANAPDGADPHTWACAHDAEFLAAVDRDLADYGATPTRP
jgi:hypothetical protein